MLVRQISNLFELMEFFAKIGKPQTAKDIVEALGWPRSSAFNIISTLVEHGYLYQPQRRGAYYPTSKWMELACDFAASQPIPETVHELLEQLSQETGETLFLAISEGREIVFLDVVESSADIRFIASIGKRLPIHLTAAGRAILSQYSPAERTQVLSRIDYAADSAAQVLLDARAVEENIKSSQQRGWFVNLGLYAPGVAGLAVPSLFLDDAPPLL